MTHVQGTLPHLQAVVGIVEPLPAMSTVATVGAATDTAPPVLPVAAGEKVRRSLSYLAALRQQSRHAIFTAW